MLNYLDQLIKTTTLEKISYLVKTFGRKELEVLYQKLKTITNSDDEVINKSRGEIETKVIELFKKAKNEKS